MDLKIDKKTLIMGIINVTPDSFSDGGRFLSKDDAVSHAEYLVDCGADIIDVGGESTKPYSRPVALVEELNRVVPVVEMISSRIDIPISVDTMKSEVAERAIDVGATIVNDVSSLSNDPNMVNVVAKHKVCLVLMHMKGTPQNMQDFPVYENLLDEVKLFLLDAVNKAVDNGVNKSSIIIDPGLGFGKTLKHNFELLSHLDEFKELGFPILIGPSRKAFIRNTLGLLEKKDIDPLSLKVEFGTQAVVAVSSMKGASIVRVHDVINTRATLDIVDFIKNL